MPNIVYVLTNPAMPGIVKIGLTQRNDVQPRMAELFSTGVPLPFECTIARQLEGIEASQVENALHIAFGPNRVHPYREFFQIESEQVEAVLQVMPGVDVTPGVIEQTAALQPEDSQAAEEFKRNQIRANETDFLRALNESARAVYEKVLELGMRNGMGVYWGRSGFSLRLNSNGEKVTVCTGYPPAKYNQDIYTDFKMLRRKTNVPEEVIESLRSDALSTGLFVPIGGIGELACRTEHSLDESQLATLIGWLESVIIAIRGDGQTTVTSNQS
ncbi:MAG: GIY-YIG nuclease family protein [Chloroflexota bacterium]|nr:GIY-YIG nuclease family protein [Chloroflexota bacterium]MDE2941353.1 GIY-YIG nuclease family protein [Chloroflexota bacterium]MDE3267452.1 GIY-YIG nuclease family protein [Chloroflexota bacterium]